VERYFLGGVLADRRTGRGAAAGWIRGESAGRRRPVGVGVRRHTVASAAIRHGDAGPGAGARRAKVRRAASGEWCGEAVGALGSGIGTPGADEVAGSMPTALAWSAMSRRCGPRWRVRRCVPAFGAVLRCRATCSAPMLAAYGAGWTSAHRRRFVVAEAHPDRRRPVWS